MKYIIILLLVASSFATSAFAAGKEEVPAAALESFQKSFNNAKEATWTAGEGFLKVEFSFNQQYVAAYYTPEGALLAMTKNILSTQLPLMLESNLKNNYSCYWITELMEVSNEDGVTYYATLQNANSRIVLKSSFNSWSQQKKIKL
jgi:hypothetical protein